MVGVLQLNWSDASGVETLHRAMAQLEPRKVRRAAALALNRAGAMARTQTGRAMVKQTGLKRKTVLKAMKVTRARPAVLNYRISATGGDIALKHFAARETRKGVSAKPFNKRRVFAGTFIKGGRFPGRVDLGMNGQVFARTGSGRFPIVKQRSGVVIPTELVRGESGKAWTSTVGRVLPVRVGHELGRLTRRDFS